MLAKETDSWKIYDRTNIYWMASSAKNEAEINVEPEEVVLVDYKIASSRELQKHYTINHIQLGLKRVMFLTI